jgi:DNA-binding phage protein
MSKTALTRPFNELVEDSIRRDPAYARALLAEAAQCFLDGEFPVARELIRKVITGSIGYAELSRRTGTPEKSLVRMFGPAGNPTGENITSVFTQLQRAGGVNLKVSVKPSTRKPPKRRTVTRRVA